jgi:hypothetical protein
MLAFLGSFRLAALVRERFGLLEPALYAEAAATRAIIAAANARLRTQAAEAEPPNAASPTPHP